MKMFSNFESGAIDVMKTEPKDDIQMVITRRQHIIHSLGRKNR